jgi:beta-barrel assembly-enhancing protease
MREDRVFPRPSRIDDAVLAPPPSPSISSPAADSQTDRRRNRMKGRTQGSRLRRWTAAAVLLLGSWPAARAIAQANAGRGKQDPEIEIGEEVFRELKGKGEIVESSPLYDVLMPVIDPILKTAQPRYPHPFKVYIVHEAQPNAFATPGGKIYVVDKMLTFAKNKEQLAGTLCHEVAHTIHHDSMDVLVKQRRIRRHEIEAAIILGPTRARILAIALLGKLHQLGYSRDVEARADLTGSDICAAAGSNPWGLVWLFQEFKDARTAEVPQLLSDHPADQNRIDALERHFKSDPATFQKFDSNPSTATVLKVPKDAPETFMH